MKIVQTRKEHICSYGHCCFANRTLEKGSIAIMKLIKKEESWFTLYFHPECYVQSKGDYVRHKMKLYMEQVEEKRLRKKVRNKGGRIGRPPKTNNPQRYRNLKSLLYHHRKAGNRFRVEELLAEIEGMELP